MEWMQTHPLDQTEDLTKLEKASLVAHFACMPDPRMNRRKAHDLVDILVIAVCTLLCAGETFNDMEDFGKAKRDWFKTFLNLRNGIPSHDTFNRVFAALDPQQFLDCFLRWTQSLREVVHQEIVALDGKALRRALKVATGVGVKRLHCDDRRHGLPEEDRPRDYRGRCRLCLGP